MADRGEHLKIFDIKYQKSPTLAEITLSLIQGEDSSDGISTVVDWISDGIKAQNNQ
jgi:hypothetical protein